MPGPSATDRERAIWWEKTAMKYKSDANYYQDEMVKAQAMIGRLIMQFGDKGKISLSKYRPPEPAPRIK